MDERPAFYERPENFLESMLAAQRDGRCTDAEVFGNTMSMLLAGEDTTAHTLSWAAWYMARNPTLQRRIADAAHDTLGRDRVAPTTETADAFADGDVLLRETLRLKSPAPFLFVEPLEDTTVAGVELSKGTRLVLLTRFAAVLDDRAFNARRTHDPKRALAFGAGPRFCPSRNLALLEARVALGMLARGFEFVLDPAAPPVRERFRFTMQPTGLRVLLRERQ
jgi:cytochrome P450